MRYLTIPYRLACGMDDSMLRLNPMNLLYKYRWTSEHKYAVGVKLPVFKWEEKMDLSWKHFLTVLHNLEKFIPSFFLTLFYCFTLLGHNNTPAVFDLHIISFLHLQASLRHYTICSANTAWGYSKIMTLKFQAWTIFPHLNSEVFMVMSCKTPTQQHKIKKKN